MPNTAIKKLPNIAVLMATYNGEQYIEDQIKSILNQNDVNLDLYIYDDGSTDKTLSIIKKYQQKSNKIYQSINVKKRGSANNFYSLIVQMRSKKYDFFAFSDQDDIWPDHKLSRAIEQLKTNNCDGYASDFIYFNRNINFSYFKKSYPQQKYDFFFETPGPGCSFVLTKNLFDDLQMFLKEHNNNEFEHHDWFIYAFARTRNYLWYIDDSPNLFYRQHYSNEVGVNQGLRAYIKRLIRILMGQWYDQIYRLVQLLEFDNLHHLSRRELFIFFFKNFYHTRRNPFHAFLMIPFLFLIGLHKK